MYSFFKFVIERDVYLVSKMIIVTFWEIKIAVSTWSKIVEHGGQWFWHKTFSLQKPDLCQDIDSIDVSFHREAVTMLSYALYVDGELVPPFTVLYSQRTLVYNMSMISLATRFPVYVLKDRLLDRGDQFTLHFTTKINYLDFDGGLRTQLLDVIKRKWHGKIKNFVCKINIIYSLKGSSLIAFTHYRY